MLKVKPLSGRKRDWFATRRIMKSTKGAVARVRQDRMRRSTAADVLADPEIQRRTERILALREEERQTREKFAADTLRIMTRLSDQVVEIRGRKGSLTGDSKKRVLAAIESLRCIVLKWPAWATPAGQRQR
jgi:hypothetical protein